METDLILINVFAETADEVFTARFERMVPLNLTRESECEKPSEQVAADVMQ